MKRCGVVITAMLLCAASAWAGTTNLVVQPNGDGVHGRSDYGTWSSWEKVDMDTTANPNQVTYDWDSSDSWGIQRNTCLQASLSPLSGLTGTDITSATAYLYVTSIWNSGTQGKLYHAADASAATGVADESIACSEHVVDIQLVTAGIWISADVTNFLRNDLDNGYDYSVFEVKYGDKWTGFNFASGESANAPYIEVVATPEPASLTLLGLGGLALLRRRRA